MRARLPGSLRSRLFLILLAGLLTSQALAFAVMLLERDQSARAVMLTTLQRDVAVAVALLDRLPGGPPGCRSSTGRPTGSRSAPARRERRPSRPAGG
jgi:hypothetical protein